MRRGLALGNAKYISIVKIAVVGAGPAGISAARNLTAAGHRVVVFEESDEVGGRTRTLRPADGHVVDSGAGWLTTFYPKALEIVDELGMREDLCQLDLTSASRLSDRGETVYLPQSVREALTTKLVPTSEKLRLVLWVIGLMARQRRADLEPDLHFDAVDALAHTSRKVGPASARLIFTPLVSAVFSDLSTLSAALLRTWLRAGIGAKFFAPADGMNSVWKSAAAGLDVRTSTAVSEIAVGHGSGVDVVTDESERFDGVIAAGTITSMRELLSGYETPSWISEVTYAPHFRVYAAIRGEVERADIHPLEVGEPVATISRGPAGRLWGTVPDGWGAALIGSCGPWSGELIAAGDAEATERLWGRAREIDPDLFELDLAEVVTPIRWPESVPIFAPGHFRRIKSFRQRPPVVFAGDWLVQPCVEGAVRSGIGAARVFGRG